MKELGASGDSKEQIADNESDLSKVMMQSNALQNFGKGKEGTGGKIIEIPPSMDSRRFNECDIIGNLERDEKGNVIPGETSADGT